MSVHSMPVLTDAEVAGRVDALIAGMTTAEKAGQLTQFFYFDLPPAGEAADQASGGAAAPGPSISGQGITVDEALARGEVGSLLFVTDPARDQPAAAARDRGQPARHTRPVRLRRHPRPAHDLPGADRHGRVVGSRRHRAGPGRGRPRGPGGRHPLGVRADGRHRARPPVGPDRRGRGRGPVPRRRGRRRPGARLPGRRLGARRPRHRRPEALRRLRRGARRTRLRRGQPVRLRALERLPAPVQGGRRRGRREHHDRLHGPQRRARHRQPLAA